MAAASNTSPDVWTIRRVLEWTRQHLAEHGSESPRLDAEILLAHARGCPRIQLYTHFDDVLSDEVRSRMRELVKRRAKHEPVAYLVGYREFFSLEFEVNRDVLIPRPETELLVVETLDAIKGKPMARVLDLGTGSGCIAVSVAANAPEAIVIGTELSSAARAVAERNTLRHGVADRVTILGGDLFQPLDKQERFDVIVSNPPYVSTGESGRLPPEVELHEPKSALFAGADGLDTIRRIVAQSPAYLKPQGTLLIEFSPEQAAEIVTLFSASGEFKEVTILRDLSQNARAVRAIRAIDDL